MSDISGLRIGAVRTLIERAPDGAIRTLEAALAKEADSDQAIALVHDLISAEVLDRRVRKAVFAPLLPLCPAPQDGFPRMSFPASAPALTWAGLKAQAPDEVRLAVRSGAFLKPGDEVPPIFDELCRMVAIGLRAGCGKFSALSDALEGQAPGTTERFALLMSLVPVARIAVARLPEWVRGLSKEHAAAVRLSFWDAVSVGNDAGPALMEILFGHVEEPRLVLRLLSLVMDRPNDRYLAASEMASFGERLLADVDRRILAVRAFDLTAGPERGAALARSVGVAAAIMHEFDQWLVLARDGPWGGRIVEQKRELALAVEGRIREAEDLVGRALPTQPVRMAARSVRGGPKLAQDLDPLAVLRAHTLLAFFEESRNSASHVGFGSLRAKVAESLSARLEQYAEDLLDHLHGVHPLQGEEPPAERVRAYLELSAEFLGLIRDPKAAEIVRRRAAAA